MNFLLDFSLKENGLMLFGFILLLGLIGGEIARHSRFLPQITGYIFTGILVGFGGFNLVTPAVLENMHIFIEISLGLILFDLGRHLDFTWLKHDRGLVLMSITESGLTFILIFAVLYFLIHLSWLLSLFAATIAMSTSPAVVMMVAHDLASEGPVTRRVLILTSLNNFFALVIFTLLLPLANSTFYSGYFFWGYPLYKLLGSFVLGFSMFVVIKLLTLLTGKHERSQFILYIGTVMLTIGLAKAAHFSTMLTLFSLGVAARNFDYNHTLMELDFGWLARIFFIVLFVITGVYLQLQGLWQTTLAVLIFIIVRAIAKTAGIWIFSKTSRLTTQQSFTLSLALLPMAGVAVGMSYKLAALNYYEGQELLLIIMAAIAVLNIIGPVLTQYALIRSGEAAIIYK